MSKLRAKFNKGKNTITLIQLNTFFSQNLTIFGKMLLQSCTRFPKVADTLLVVFGVAECEKHLLTTLPPKKVYQLESYRLGEKQRNILTYRPKCITEKCI